MAAQANLAKGDDRIFRGGRAGDNRLNNLLKVEQKKQKMDLDVQSVSESATRKIIGKYQILQEIGEGTADILL